MKRKAVLTGIISFFAALMVFAAGSKDSAGDPSKKSVIRVLVWSSTFDQKIGPNNIEADFEAKYPQYDLEIDKIDYDSLDKQILLSHSTGNGYDVIMINHSSLSQFVHGGVVAPLDAYLADGKIDFSYYSDKAVKASKFKGKTYGIPFDPDCRILAYNTKILKELGMTPPKTTDDMLKIAKAAYAKGYYAMAGGLNRTTFCVYDLGGFMLNWGIHVYEQGTDGKYVARLDTPEAVDYMHWAQQMYACMPKDANLDNTVARSMFAQGKVAMMWWTPSQIASVIPKFQNREDLDFSVMPVGPTGYRSSAMGGYMWGIGSKAKNPKGAWAFLSYALQPEMQGKFARGLPADSRAFDYPPFNKADYNMFREQLPKAEYPCPLTSVLPKVFETWNRTYSECMMGLITPEEACKKGQADVQAVLNTIN
ncbi:sugar ABC transporter substrate-binding protein [Treponema sp. OMZ 840]|uniref:ABC transporter substrate-binding protein n=1 Tax=Treponema sp. OMZ 840 TaxID=244313 RepID=UPI003D8C2278